MDFVIFGLTLSSSWGNGHATLWRGLLGALAERGHRAVFYEKDVPYYAAMRDGWPAPQGIQLRIYEDIESIRAEVSAELARADVAVVTSYCADGRVASDLVNDSPVAVKIFYDLDTPVTLDAVHSGQPVPYLPATGLGAFDLVLSFTGGRALNELSSRLFARRVAPFYGWVDPKLHRPESPSEEFRSEFSYLGTFAADRQPAVEKLFINPATARPQSRFVLAGAQYPNDFPWKPNIFFMRHLPPSLHSAFFCSGRATLNVTRRSMAEYGYCPSGRLFEAAACGAAIVSDVWEGLDTFFTPGYEILPVSTASDVLAALELSDAELRTIAAAGRDRVLEQHSAAARAIELEQLLETPTNGNVAPDATILRKEDGSNYVGNHSGCGRG